MALFADRCDDSHIQFSDFTDFLGCRILSLLRYANEIQELVDKEYICRNRDEGFYYTIPMEVMEAFQHNERYNPMDVEELTFSELNLSSMRGSRPKGGMLSFEDISPKQLFYNSKEQRQVEELTSLLDEEHFKRIKNRLKETNFRSGFACLFYGAPGTGKTETVLQIAKKTGRDLIQVNVSEVKSMWVGESEKNIKGIFDDYKKKVKQLAKAPILLFNEADAIIGKRQVGAERAVEKMENSIQNIILQEIEQLDGILIATTNLAENMDKAFERRFLYKIQFEKPDLNCRTQIWQAMIPPLNDADASYLAGKYDFSGGEIENIARHFTIQTILHGQSENMVKSLVEFCENERLEGSRTKRKIGF